MSDSNAMFIGGKLYPLLDLQDVIDFLTRQEVHVSSSGFCGAAWVTSCLC
jgi:hypothetical protein